MLRGCGTSCNDWFQQTIAVLQGFEGQRIRNLLRLRVQEFQPLVRGEILAIEYSRCFSHPVPHLLLLVHMKHKHQMVLEL